MSEPTSITLVSKDREAFADIERAGYAVPRRWHICLPVHWIGSNEYCACGARRGFWTKYQWINRNGRRKAR